MKVLKNIKNTINLRLVFCVAALSFLFLGALQSAQAQTPVTFAQFFERIGGQDFVFTNASPNSTFNTVSGGSPILFIYQNINGTLDPSLQGGQNARLFLVSGTTAPAISSGSDLTQPLNNAGNTIRIIRDTPAPAGVGTGARTNLLTITFSPNLGTPDVTGNTANGSTALSAGSGNNIVSFSSDFLTFTNTTARAFALSFSSVNPGLSVGPNGFLNSFSAAATGTFSSNPAPVVTAGPTAATVNVSGRVLTAAGRGLRNAQVTLTEADGSSHTVLTGISGHYTFTDVPVGQTVVLAVNSKHYRFLPQVLSLTDEVSEVNFVVKF